MAPVEIPTSLNFWGSSEIFLGIHHVTSYGITLLALFRWDAPESRLQIRATIEDGAVFRGASGRRIWSIAD